MPIITDLRPSKKSKDLVLLYKDHRYYLRIPIDLVIKYGLKIGHELDKKLDRKLRVATSRQYFFDRAVNFLSYRPRSRSEVSQYLKSKLKAMPSTIEKILTKLTHLGLQDDNTFAEWLIRSRVNQGKSLMFIKRELYQKGIDSEIVSAKLQEQESSLPTDSKIIRCFQKYNAKDPKTALLKLKYHYTSKGFTQSEIKSIIEVIKNSETSI